MTKLIDPKQIGKIQQAFVGITTFTPAGGTSDSITSALTSALSSASAQGGNVPLQVGSATTEGVDTATGFNLARIYAVSTGKVYQDGNGNDVYGKISFASGTWTLSYFSNIAGTETAFTMPTSPAISFEVPYYFTFEHLPPRASTAVSERHAAPDLAAYAYRTFVEALTVTATNTLSSLSQTYAPGASAAVLFVNGVPYSDKDTAANFSISGKTITWSATNAKFSLSTDDTVTIQYPY